MRGRVSSLVGRASSSRSVRGSTPFIFNYLLFILSSARPFYFNTWSNTWLEWALLLTQAMNANTDPSCSRNTTQTRPSVAAWVWMSPWPPGATQGTPVCTAQPPDICTAFRGNRSHRYRKPWLWWSHGPRSGLWQQLRPRWHHSPRWQRGHLYRLAPDSGHPLDPHMATGGSPEPKHRCGKHIIF